MNNKDVVGMVETAVPTIKYNMCIFKVQCVKHHKCSSTEFSFLTPLNSST